MGHVAIVTDSAADLTPEMARAAGITVVPLIVTFGTESFRAGVDLTTEAFWERLLAPGAPFPTTAAAAPGAFQEAYEAAFAQGAGAVVSIHVGAKLSGTIKSAQIARDLLPGREIHLVDSRVASMGVGLLALLAAEMARAGAPAAEIVRTVEARIEDLVLYVAIDTLEYLRRGGRLGATQAALGTLLAIKPIITVREGAVATADRVRTRSQARRRVLELLTVRPAERVAVLYTPPADPLPFRDELVARLPSGVDPSAVSIHPVGASVGPHLGPGCLGAVILARRET